MNTNIETKIVKVAEIKINPKNPKKHLVEKISESMKEMGYVEPIVVDENFMILAGHGRLKCLKANKIKEIEVVIRKGLTNQQKEKYMLLSNKIVEAGGWDFNLLKEFDEALLLDSAFSSEELDEIFEIDHPEQFDLKKELEKLNIKEVKVKKGDIYEIDGSKLLCGDSTLEADVLKLMGDQKADMCFTDPPYILEYLKGKTRQKDGAVTGFGVKKNRRYLETDILPDDFTEKWMKNISKVQREDFSIIIFENPKNLKTIWIELEKHWKYRNTITWHIPNRVQGFSAKYKFFNKTDIALVGTKGNVELNFEPEADELFRNEYENALFATSGKPHWESYSKGKKYCPTDFIEHIAADEKSSGQGVIFGTKPLELLIPYIKVLTKRDDLIIEPFGGSGSTLIASLKLKRRCYLMEKSPVYAEVIIKRWEKFTGKKVKKIN